MNRKIISIFILALVLFSSCQKDVMEGVGYLRLDIQTNSFVNVQTKVGENYNPKQIAVQIVNSSNSVVKETDDWETLKGQQIELPSGTYTIKASSNGFDGSESGFGLPYYTGSTQVTVSSGKEVTAEISCTLANVKVTVNFDQSFVNAFKSATATVSSSVSGVNPLDFVMGQTTVSGYFPVGDLTSRIAVVNKDGEAYSQTNTLSGVKARDHYILNYKVADSGYAGKVEIKVDESETVYTFIFNVSTEAKTSLEVKSANAWSRTAYIEGMVGASVEELDPGFMSFEYKLSSSDSWSSVAAAKEGDAFKATLTGLSPATKYDYRLAYRNNSVEYVSNEASFTTETQTDLVNGNMDDWYKSGKTWYPASEAYFNANGSFWDTSNPGTTTGAGALVNVNPTQGSSSVVHTASGMSAELKSQYASAFGIGKFASASLYTGKFNSLVGTSGAKIDFGQPFTSRPTALHGFFRYSTSTIDYLGSNTPSEFGLVKGSSLDACSIYIALATKAYQIDNTDTSTFIDFQNDSNIIAYGELPLSECVSTNGQWKEFTIELDYRSQTVKPSYLILVCSSSRYGDYFTGSTSSLMYVDDMNFIYGK